MSPLTCSPPSHISVHRERVWKEHRFWKQSGLGPVPVMPLDASGTSSRLPLAYLWFLKGSSVWAHLYAHKVPIQGASLILLGGAGQSVLWIPGNLQVSLAQKFWGIKAALTQWVTEASVSMPRLPSFGWTILGAILNNCQRSWWNRSSDFNNASLYRRFLLAPSPLLPGITSHTNYLQENPHLRLCFPRNPSKDIYYQPQLTEPLWVSTSSSVQEWWTYFIRVLAGLNEVNTWITRHTVLPIADS